MQRFKGFKHKNSYKRKKKNRNAFNKSKRKNRKNRNKTKKNNKERRKKMPTQSSLRSTRMKEKMRYLTIKSILQKLDYKSFIRS